IFSITKRLSEYFETCALDPLQARRMVQSAIGKLKMIRRDFPTVLNIATKFAKKAKNKRASFNTDVAVEERKLPFGKKDDTDNRAMDAHQYQVNLFNVVMDQIVTSTNST
ncbi:Hypothetical predicted protein, partial [Paramuricea clavata]